MAAFVLSLRNPTWVWDLQTGTRQTADRNGPSLPQDRFRVPLRIREILGANDNDTDGGPSVFF
jgi:hypothetical protein